MVRRLRATLMTMIVLACCTLAGSAQWLTQTIELVPGWNAIYLHVDPSHETIDNILGLDPANPIEEVWLWRSAPATAQFVTSPQLPTTVGSQWVTWTKSLGIASELQALKGNAAYLIKLGGIANYIWNLKGKPVGPNYRWTSTGLNFIGFATTPNNPPNFETFLAPSDGLTQNAEIFTYSGGELNANNPAKLFALRTTEVKRGTAYWIRSGNLFNRYFGPFEVSEEGGTALKFGTESGQGRFRLRNLTQSPLTISMGLLNSESPPANQPSIEPSPLPLLLRGPLNPSDLTYGFTDLRAGEQMITLAAVGRPGSEADIVIGLNRSQMTGPILGARHAGILRLRDTLGLSQVDLPASAEVSPRSGLWLGTAMIDNVQHYLKSYQLNPDGTLKTGPSGSYIPSATNLATGPVARPFPLKLIIHDTGSTTRLLQRVYHGLESSTNPVVALSESSLNPILSDTARRISCTHLPWTPNNQHWLFSQSISTLFGNQSGNQISVTVPLAHNNHASNPFLHTYHPDHDGLDVKGTTQLQRGMESYDIIRNIVLTFTPPANDFASLTSGNGSLNGIYSETVTLLGAGSNTRQFSSSGTFAIHRISSIPTLSP